MKRLGFREVYNLKNGIINLKEDEIINQELYIEVATNEKKFLLRNRKYINIIQDKNITMRNKFIILFFLFIMTSIFSGCSSNNLECNDKKIILKGKLKTIEDKYTIRVIETPNQTYWIYGSADNFQKNLNKSVKIEAKISHFNESNSSCYICHRECETQGCQCPGRDLLYNVKILEVYENNNN